MYVCPKRMQQNKHSEISKEYERQREREAPLLSANTQQNKRNHKENEYAGQGIMRGYNLYIHRINIQTSLEIFPEGEGEKWEEMQISKQNTRNL